MAIIKYREGEHPGGFVGLRVVTTLGSNTLYRQRYYPFNEYSEEAAWIKAEALNKRWREQANEAAQTRMLQAHAFSGVGWIARGFRGSIRCEKKWRGGEHRRYYSPGFLVDGVPALGLPHRFFSINHPAGVTIADVFEEALYCYAVRRELTRDMIHEVKQRALPPEIFIMLAKNYENQGCDLARIRKRVGLT